MAPAISIRPLCMFLLPMPALVSDRQSIRRTVPALMACESWYAAPAAFSELAPEAAASFEKPLMTDVACSTFIPALVNRAALAVMSANE